MRPEHRLRIEAVLTKAERKFVASVCRALGLPADQWPMIPSLRQMIEQLAWAHRTEQLRIADGEPRLVTRVRAADELGLNLDTLLRRRRRWIERTKCPEIVGLEN